jgi:hypothetical protein
MRPDPHPFVFRRKVKPQPTESWWLNLSREQLQEEALRRHPPGLVDKFTGVTLAVAAKNGTL